MGSKDENLLSLFLDNDATFTGHPYCEGCSMLTKAKPFHGQPDYEDATPVDVLFLTESYVVRNGGISAPVRSNERKVVEDVLQGVDAKFTVAFSPSVKCPSVKDKVLSAKDRDICRAHLRDTIEAFKPKLIFTLGNAPLVMLLKKSGVSNKRGSMFVYDPEGLSIPVMPLYHPYSVISEPKNKVLFEQDIRVGIDKFLIGKKTEVDLNLVVLDSLGVVKDFADVFSRLTMPVACDIETTGLDFRKDVITTIAFGTDLGTYVIPLFHKDSPFTPEEAEFILRDCIKPILGNPHNRKIFHKIQFDAKFLLRYGVDIVNGWDTKVMMHLYNEEAPRSLMDCVKEFFPTELDAF